MFYFLVKCWIRAGLLIYFRNIKFTDRTVLKEKGPLLLACNHPNSFLDAIVVGSHFNCPVHFLARGDAFRHPLARRLLRALKMIPIYRLSEGKEHLALNDATFEQCKQLFLQGGIVLIFSEGLCKNQWILRPLKKGTGRIVFYKGDRKDLPADLRIVPVGLNYTVFGKMERQVLVSTGRPYSPYTTGSIPDPEAMRKFNGKLAGELRRNVLEDDGDIQTLRSLLNNLPWRQPPPDAITVLQRRQAAIHGFHGTGMAEIPPLFYTLNERKTALAAFTVLLLFIPALLSVLVHGPLYLGIRNFARKKTAGTVFYDSVLFGLLLIIYPVYWLLLTAVVWFAGAPPIIITLAVLMPVLAWLHGIFDTSVKRLNGTGRTPPEKLQRFRKVMV